MRRIFTLLVCLVALPAAALDLQISADGTPAPGNAQQYLEGIDFVGSGWIRDSDCVDEQLNGTLHARLILHDQTATDFDVVSYWLIYTYAQATMTVEFEPGPGHPQYGQRQKVLEATSSDFLLYEHSEWGGFEFTHLFDISERAPITQSCNFLATREVSGARTYIWGSGNWNSDVISVAIRVDGSIQSVTTENNSWSRLKAIYGSR